MSEKRIPLSDEQQRDFPTDVRYKNKKKIAFTNGHQRGLPKDHRYVKKVQHMIKEMFWIAWSPYQSEEKTCTHIVGIILWYSVLQCFNVSDKK